MSRLLLLLALGGIAHAGERALPGSYAGWWAYPDKGKNTRCRLVDAKLDRELRVLRCHWSKPEDTTAIVCDPWTAYRTKNACLKDRSMDEDSEGDQH